MKRFTSLALMLAVMFCFSVSCSGDGHADVTSPPADTSEDSSEEVTEVTTYRHVEDSLPKDLDEWVRNQVFPWDICHIQPKVIDL